MRHVNPTPNKDIFDMRQGRMEMHLPSSKLHEIATVARDQAVRQLTDINLGRADGDKRDTIHFQRELREIESFLWLLEMTDGDVRVDNVFMSRLMARYAAAMDDDSKRPY